MDLHTRILTLDDTPSGGGGRNLTAASGSRRSKSILRHLQMYLDVYVYKCFVYYYHKVFICGSYVLC